MARISWSSMERFRTFCRWNFTGKGRTQRSGYKIRTCPRAPSAYSLISASMRAISVARLRAWRAQGISGGCWCDAFRLATKQGGPKAHFQAGKTRADGRWSNGICLGGAGDQPLLNDTQEESDGRQIKPHGRFSDLCADPHSWQQTHMTAGINIR